VNLKLNAKNNAAHVVSCRDQQNEATYLESLEPAGALGPIAAAVRAVAAD